MSTKKYFETTPLPSIPNQVQLDELQSNNKLYAEELIEKIKSLDLPDGRTTKKVLLQKLNATYPEDHFKQKDVNFSVDKHDENYNAIYQGKGRELYAVDELPQERLNQFTNSYLLIASPQQIFYIDSEAKEHQLAINDPKKFADVVQYFKHIQKEEPLSAEFAESQALIKDLQEIIGENPGHERLKKGNLSLGAGAFGSVKLTQNLDTGDWNVIKILKEADTAKLNIEVANLQQANQLENVSQRSNQHGKVQNEIIMKRAQGVDLHKIAYSNMKLSSSDWIDISINMLKALQEIHQLGLLHRDITSHNFMLNPVTKEVTLIDFGLAIAVDDVAKGIKEVDAEWMKGTFNSPETRNEFIYNEKTEVYLMGIALGHAMNLMANEYGDSFLNINDPNFIENSKIPDQKTREEIFSLVKKMSADEPESRPTVEQAITNLQQIRNELLDINALTAEVIFLNINQFTEAHAEEKTNMLDSMRGTQEVWLIDPQPDNHQIVDYEKIKRELEKNGINVNLEIVHPLSQNIEKVMKEYASAQELKDQHIYHYSYFSPDKKLQTFAKPDLAEKGFKQIYQKLVSEGHRPSSQAQIYQTLGTKPPAPSTPPPVEPTKTSAAKVSVKKEVEKIEKRIEANKENINYQRPSKR